MCMFLKKVYEIKSSLDFVKYFILKEYNYDWIWKEVVRSGKLFIYTVTVGIPS